MEKLTTNNQLSTEEFKLFCMNHQMEKKQSQKEIDFLEFTSFILNTAIHNEEDMGFLLNKEYQQGNFESAVYSRGENETWNALQELTGRDYDTMEEDFKSVRWEDNDNTAIVSFENDVKEYTILRM